MFIGLAGGFVNISYAQVQAAYARERDAQRAYQTYNRIVGTICKSVDRVGDKIHRHHSRPKYLGGPVDQDLVDVADDVHRQLHSLLSILTRVNGYPVRTGSQFAALPGSGQSDVLEILKQTTKAFDAACTGVPGYNAIYPKLEQYL